ncbi:hypothetical protein PULV_a1043 [Pseudoalteromonas ulvae UL12]|nr:hypothetical protein [Pseudoalteromonas ulvae UL12]
MPCSLNSIGAFFIMMDSVIKYQSENGHYDTFFNFGSQLKLIKRSFL